MPKQIEYCNSPNTVCYGELSSIPSIDVYATSHLALYRWLEEARETDTTYQVNEVTFRTTIEGSIFFIGTWEKLTDFMFNLEIAKESYSLDLT